MLFKHTAGNVKLPYVHPVTGVSGFCSGGGGGAGHSTTGAPVSTVTMCAVGVGIAPMVGRRSLKTPPGAHTIQLHNISTFFGIRWVETAQVQLTSGIE